MGKMMETVNKNKGFSIHCPSNAAEIVSAERADSVIWQEWLTGGKFRAGWLNKSSCGMQHRPQAQYSGK